MLCRPAMNDGVQLAARAGVAAQRDMGVPVRVGDPGNFRVIRRVFNDYIRTQWATFAAALGCMIITSAASGTIPLIVNQTVKALFIDKQASMLAVIPVLVVALMTVRAVSWYAQQTLIDTVGERVVARVQRDMFDRLIRRDLASLNAVHSSQFISTMLYDATLLRDAITRGVAACGLETAQLIAYAAVVVYDDWQLTLLALVVLPPVARNIERHRSFIRRAATRGMEQTRR